MTTGLRLPPASADEEWCLEWLWHMRFSDDGVHADCPKCEQRRVFTRYKTKNRFRCWWCTSCHWTANVLRDTPLARTKLPLTAWFDLIRIVVEGAPADKEIERRTGLTPGAARRAKGLVERWLAAGGVWPDERRNFPVAPPRRYRGREYKTHCKRGHRLAGRNIRVEKDGGRRCRVCDRLRKERTRGICVECGGLTGIGSKGKHRLCLACVKAAREVVRAENVAARARQLRPELFPTQADATVKAYRNHEPAAGLRLTDKQKALVRILQVAPAPLSARTVSGLLSRLPRRWVGVEPSGLLISLGRLERRSIVQRVFNTDRRGKVEPRFLWLVPALDGRIVLILDDAVRERELAALIQEQEREVARGDWSQDEKGHWGDVRLDAPRRVDGDDWHEALEDVAA